MALLEDSVFLFAFASAFLSFHGLSPFAFSFASFLSFLWFLLFASSSAFFSFLSLSLLASSSAVFFFFSSSSLGSFLTSFCSGFATVAEAAAAPEAPLSLSLEELSEV